LLEIGAVGYNFWKWTTQVWSQLSWF